MNRRVAGACARLCMHEAATAVRRGDSVNDRINEVSGPPRVSAPAEKTMHRVNRQSLSLRVAGIVAALTMMGGTSGSAWAQGGPQAPPSMVAVETAEQDQYSATRWAPGTVISRHDIRISAEQGGRINWIAEIGEEIVAGDPLARIDDDSLQLELLDNAARIQQLEAQLSYQSNQYERLRQLAASKNASSTQVDEALSQRRIIEQDLAQARIARDQINRRIQLSTVSAPFSGRVVEQLAQSGEYATVGMPLLRLVDTQDREIRVRAPLSLAEFVHEGMQVRVSHERFDAEATIRTVVPVGDERSRMFELRLIASDPRWVIGSAVRVALPVSEHLERVAIPRDAVIMRGEEMYVYVVREDNTAERVDVRTGIGIGDRVEVIGDVRAGDRLIVRGGERLRPGQSVQVMPLDGISPEPG